MIFASFAKALAQLSDPRFRWVLVQGVGLTLLLLAGLFAFAFWGIAWLVPDAVSLPLIGEIGISNTLLSWGSLLVMMVLAVLLYLLLLLVLLLREFLLFNHVVHRYNLLLVAKIH